MSTSRERPSLTRTVFEAIKSSLIDEGKPVIQPKSVEEYTFRLSRRNLLILGGGLVAIGTASAAVFGISAPSLDQIGAVPGTKNGNQDSTNKP